jgi:hypothetical protein
VTTDDERPGLLTRIGRSLRPSYGARANAADALRAVCEYRRHQQQAAEALLEAQGRFRSIGGASRAPAAR